MSFNLVQAEQDTEKHHQSIYTAKVKRIVKAINIGDHSTEMEYLDMLALSCQRNKCDSTETETVQMVGKQIINCQISHLKSHQVENQDATNICISKNAMLGCDSLATPLLRKMCYTGNNYSLKTYDQKEKKIKNRLPASIE